MYHTVMDTIERNIIWAAGFIDGEGTITFKRYNRNSQINYQPYMSCSQVDKPKQAEAIFLLKALFGGSVYRYKQKTGVKNDVIQWSIVSRNAESAIRLLRPFLKVKQEQADLALGFYENMVIRQGPRKRTQEENSYRESLWASMRRLNQKGKLTLATTERGDA